MSFDDSTNKSAMKTALTGSLTGAVLGGGARLLSRSRPAGIGDILRAAMLGGLVTGGASGGAQIVGGKLMGPPDPDDEHAYLKRGLLGGLTLGGGLGGLLGLGAAAGLKVRTPKGMPGGIKKLIGGVTDELPLDNIITDKILQNSAKPTWSTLGRGGTLGALVGGLPAGYLGADEGLIYDELQQQIHERQKEKLRREYDRLNELARISGQLVGDGFDGRRREEY